MNATISMLLIVIPVLLVSMSLHEMMHAMAAYWLGDDSAKEGGRISINPMRHIDPVLTVGLPVLLAVLGQPIFGAAKPVYIDMARIRFGEFGGAIIGLVGPLTNLIIALVAALLLRTIPALQHGIWLDILGYSVIINVGFFVFNMLPFPPLDGSRLLYAFAPEPLQRAMDFIEQQGIFFFFAFLFILYPLIFPIIQKLNNVLTSGLIG